MKQTEKWRNKKAVLPESFHRKYQKKSYIITRKQKTTQRII